MGIDMLSRCFQALLGPSPFPSPFSISIILIYYLVSVSHLVSTLSYRSVRDRQAADRLVSVSTSCNDTRGPLRAETAM